jgi:hypothetical protein
VYFTFNRRSQLRKHLIKNYHVTNNTANVSIFQGENVSVTIQNDRNSENIDFDLIFWGVLTPLSAISWRPVLVVEEVGVHGENHRPWANN